MTDQMPNLASAGPTWHYGSRGGLKPVCEAKGESIAGEGGNTRFAFALGHLP